MLLCDCNDDIFNGVPCRHQLAIAIKTKQFPSKFLRFAKRWQKNYFVDKKEWEEPLSLPRAESVIVKYIVIDF